MTSDIINTEQQKKQAAIKCADLVRDPDYNARMEEQQQYDAWLFSQSGESMWNDGGGDE